MSVTTLVQAILVTSDMSMQFELGPENLDQVEDVVAVHELVVREEMMDAVSTGRAARCPRR